MSTIVDIGLLKVKLRFRKLS